MLKKSISGRTRIPPKERAKVGEGEHPCRCSIEPNCDRTFAQKGGAITHAVKRTITLTQRLLCARRGVQTARREEKESISVHAESKTVATKLSALNMLRSTMLNESMNTLTQMCPRPHDGNMRKQDQENFLVRETDICDKTSTLEAEAIHHSKEEHEHIQESEISSIDKADIRYSLNKDGLLEMRDQQDNLITHPVQERGDEPIYRNGKEATVPCPLAEEEECIEKFVSQEGADRHTRKKHGFSSWDIWERTVPCLFAEQTNCRQMFETEDYALGHAFRKHKM
ncbi:uncharacterized protein N7483_005303 [Penicillium malachiteum]|uniref:uncharacterized protein n=1 Tax=Penicillium malachiteum TaxID=1324776 RepID=UPI002548AA1B|nr:uncharacterized protein N7483_005303 [Penicillium malachiteum]KAJ5730795.1 hypothetical protein N7483_005303 [Penicillium malachiteum]